ncbi:hypothetical protein [Roseisalinus antarcticus]|uniref:Uncharacterized protein n=1 Tax=Roseisalinus antarcticus TaxID=254357 RepID=A0A1Y5T3F6_9RHOB|nr:hypothetical protein [Roseisalinus antarcticus]SLN54843.1 hypothetical protein ROA7023_02474 [Roseisalinus antarcticus]
MRSYHPLDERHPRNRRPRVAATVPLASATRDKRAWKHSARDQTAHIVDTAAEASATKAAGRAAERAVWQKAGLWGRIGPLGTINGLRAWSAGRKGRGVSGLGRLATILGAILLYLALGPSFLSLELAPNFTGGGALDASMNTVD